MLQPAQLESPNLSRITTSRFTSQMLAIRGWNLCGDGPPRRHRGVGEGRWGRRGCTQLPDDGGGQHVDCRSCLVLIRYYGKRWGIEAGFRDIKDMRFGMGLSSMHVSRPDRRDRLLLISALAIAVLSLLGAAGERIGYDRWLKANTVKRRTHSLFRQGLMLYHHLPQLARGSGSSVDGDVRKHAHRTAGVSRGLRRDLMPAKIRGCMRVRPWRLPDHQPGDRLMPQMERGRPGGRPLLCGTRICSLN